MWLCSDRRTAGLSVSERRLTRRREEARDSLWDAGCGGTPPWPRAARSEGGAQGGLQEVNIVTTRFGLVQASESDVIRIPEGLVGFRSFTQYVHLLDPVVAGLTWLQSVTAPELAFGLIAPPLAVSEYQVELRAGDRAALE